MAALLGLAAMALAPGVAEAKRGSIYNITSASGFERVTFTGDSAAGCESFGVCGYTGTVTYAIGGKPRGKLVLARSRNGKVSGGATYRTTGVTEATVTPPGDGPDCTDTVRHKVDVFSMASAGPRFQSLLLTYHLDGDDYLDTDCPGPNERDAAEAGALPEGSFRAADFFKGERPRLELSGGFPFISQGFSAASEWDLRFRAKGRACNPRCRIPAERPR
jgi:hypothetical protein